MIVSSQNAESAQATLASVVQSPFLWICALTVFAVIGVQSWIYMRAARQAGEGIGMSHGELNQAFRSGAIASIGPSLAVVLVAIALLTLFGTPGVLLRIGLVGSAATETGSATIAAESMGASLGGPDYTAQVFVVAFTAMSISGGAWMLATLVLTPLLKRGGVRLAKVNPAAMALIPGAALLAAFAVLTMTELPKSGMHILAVAVSAVVMAVLLYIAARFHMSWLKEWALGISILAALTVVYFVHA